MTPAPVVGGHGLRRGRDDGRQPAGALARVDDPALRAVGDGLVRELDEVLPV